MGAPDAGTPGRDLRGVVDAVVAAHVLELRPDGPFLGGGVVVDKGLEPFGLRRVLDVAEVGAVDVFHHVGGAVVDRHGKDGLAGSQLDLERHADIKRAAQFGGDAFPGKAGAAAVGGDFEVRETLLFAENVVVAAAGQGDEQPEGEAQLRAVQELPACRRPWRRGRARRCHGRTRGAAYRWQAQTYSLKVSSSVVMDASAACGHAP